MQITTVSYQAPTYTRVQLGSKPAYTFDQNEQPSQTYVACQGDSCNLGSEKVWGDLPARNADGTPAFVTKEAEIDLTPRSAVKYGVVGGLLGGAAGAAVGAIGASVLGLSPGVGALVGGLGGGALTGGLAAFSVKGEKVKTVWDTHEVKVPKMLGYNEMVGQGELHGERGFFHRFVPDIEQTVIGTYQTPRAERYKEDAAKEGTPS